MDFSKDSRDPSLGWVLLAPLVFVFVAVVSAALAAADLAFRIWRRIQ